MFVLQSFQFQVCLLACLMPIDISEKGTVVVAMFGFSESDNIMSAIDEERVLGKVHGNEDGNNAIDAVVVQNLQNKDNFAKHCLIPSVLFCSALLFFCFSYPVWRFFCVEINYKCSLLFFKTKRV
jgi:hypothetical protein